MSQSLLHSQPITNIFQIGAEEDLLDNNDLNLVVASSGFSENKGLGGVRCSLVGS